LNAEPNEPRKRPRLIWLILVDLLAAWLPWPLFVGVGIIDLRVTILELGAPQLYPDLVEQLWGQYAWWVLYGPILCPAWVVGIDIDWPLGAGFVALSSAMFAGHFGLAVFLQCKLYRWLKYLVPAHLFVLSTIPVGKELWWWFYGVS
jgi:hypothetical protein